MIITPRIDFRALLLLVSLLLAAVIVPPARVSASVTVEESVQAFLDMQPGPLKTYVDGQRTAADIIEGVGSYYGVSPRILLALMEATSGVLSMPQLPEATLDEPFGTAGPRGFAAQLDWAGREVRSGYGPYDQAPTVRFTDATTITIVLEQAPEGVAVQRFLAKGRSQTEWREVYSRFLLAFQTYFNYELPIESQPSPPAIRGFLQRPWPINTRVIHLAYFDHVFPTVDTRSRGDGEVVNYLGQSGMQYDSHDGHDYVFPDLPVGTLILAAADGVAYARTHRGFGVVIIHPGGYETVYWHLDKLSRRFIGMVDTDKGVPVKAGDVIGSSGKTGFVRGTPHLHFEVRHNSKQVDPYGWYGPGPDPCAVYAACEASSWLWHPDLAGEFDWTPPDRN